VIAVGQAVAVIYSSNRVVAAKISEENFGRLKVGQTARLRLLTYGEKEYEASVSELLPTADDAQRFTVYLDVKVDPEQLKPRSTGEVTITVDQRPDQVMIPRRALFDSDKVFVVKDGRAWKRRVEVGYVSLTKVEIRKGVELGEYLIVDELERFRDGARVRVQVIN
jgi:RND family efflux transporter MFP subunit